MIDEFKEYIPMFEDFSQETAGVPQQMGKIAIARDSRHNTGWVEMFDSETDELLGQYKTPGEFAKGNPEYEIDDQSSYSSMGPTASIPGTEGDDEYAKMLDDAMKNREAPQNIDRFRD